MEVVCVDNFGREDVLSVGRKYAILGCDGICYWIKNDAGIEQYYGTSRFNLVEEYIYE